MQYISVFVAYNSLFILMDDWGWDMGYIESLAPWERDVMLVLAKEKKEAQELARRQAQLAS